MVLQRNMTSIRQTCPYGARAVGAPEEQKAARYCDQAQFEREIANDDHAAMSAFGEALQADPQSAAMVGLAELTLCTVARLK